MKESEYVSALIVVKNEQDFIEKALMSLINQEYPKNLYEIIVVDGGSSDNTISIVEKIRDDVIIPSGISFQFLSNPKGILASGWNIALKAAKGEYVFRIDAHSIVGKNYIHQCLNLLREVDAVCVGGTMQSLTIDQKQKYVSSVLSSPFGVGNSKFRYSQKAQYVDTVAFGMYRKNVFDKVGYFDENLKRNQDIELHSKIRKSGGKFFLDPSIEVMYYTRNSTMKMMRQGYENGKWNLILAKKNPEALSIRHVIPMFFTIFLFVWFLLERLDCRLKKIGRGGMAIYTFFAVLVSYKQEKNMKAMLNMPILFLFLHISYGIGSIVGIFCEMEKKDGNV